MGPPIARQPVGHPQVHPRRALFMRSGLGWTCR